MKAPVRIIVSVVVALGLLFAAPAVDAKPKHKPKLNPVIFVHGGAGSGAQFESQKLRFTSNGYPQRLVSVLEYDSTFSLNTMAQVHARLDELIADLKERTNRDKVDVLGHSLGTTVMHQYLSSPARAANLAHYVNIDGAQSASPPGGVPTLALWAGRGTPGRSIGGATNVTLPNQTHVQSATSAEAFVEIYKFFRGHPPATSEILAERAHRLAVAGRVVLFPQNVGTPGGGKLAIWQIEAATGQRLGKKPVATRTISGDGSFGPLRKIKRGRHYEFAFSRGGARTGHFYFEPFTRSDYLVRILTTNPGEGSDALVEKSPNHVSLVAVRNKELWGDQGAESDVLALNGLNVLNPATAPITKRVIGMFAYDVGSDGVTNLAAPIPAFFALPFQSGVDVFMPASAAGTGTVSIGLQSRGAGPVRTLNIPDRPSTTDMNFLGFNDYE